MVARELDPVGRLAQYVLLPRIAAAGLTLISLLGDPRLAWVLLAAVPVMVVVNFVALRHWDRVVSELRIAAKPAYLALDALLGVAVLAVVGVGTPLVLYLVGTGLLAGLVYRAWAALAAGATMTLGYTVILLSGTGYVPGTLDFHTGVTLPALLLGAPGVAVAIKRVLLRSERAATEVARLRAVAAVHDERLRMARDLHDSLTKNLHGIWLLSRTMDAALGRGDVGSARPAAVAIGDTAKDLAAQSRTVIRGLRAERGRSLEEDLRSAVQRGVAGHDLVIDLRVFDPPEPSRGAREELLAVAGEAVHNSVKHAGASRVEITLGEDGGELDLVVSDDGRGFSLPDGAQPAGGGQYGLAGMRERAARVGGRLRVDTGPGLGTRVSMTVPVRRRGRRTEGAVGGGG